MKRLKIPGTEIEISRIALGCMSLKGDFLHDQSIISAALAGGINFLDTADLYQNGLNEEIVGMSIRGKRDEIVLATKVGNEMNPDGISWSWNPRKDYILKAVEKSLKRLQTDYIDLYQLHGGTIEDRLEETFEAFEISGKNSRFWDFIHPAKCDPKSDAGRSAVHYYDAIQSFGPKA